MRKPGRLSRNSRHRLCPKMAVSSSREGGAGPDKLLWVLLCHIDHRGVFHGGLQTLTRCLRLSHPHVCDVYLIILGTLSGSAAPPWVASGTCFMIYDAAKYTVMEEGEEEERSSSVTVSEPCGALK